MPPPVNQRLAGQLERLDRQNRILALLVAVLLALLAVTIASLQMASGSWDLGLSAENRYHMVVALSGLVALFSLYILHQQRRHRVLQEQLLRSTLREEFLRSRLADLASFFERVSQDGALIEMPALTGALAEHLRATLDADHVSLMLVDAESGGLATHAIAGSDPDGAAGALVPHGEGVAGTVVVTRRPLLLEAAEIASRFPAPHAPFRTAATGMCVPLPFGPQAIGVLNVTRFRSSEPFAEDDERWVSVFAAHTAVVLHRLAERRAAEQQLRDREEQLRQAQKMEALGRLAGGVAHDFNNLLTVILAHGRALAEQAPQAGGNEHAARIVAAGERCVGLTRQLLAFSRKQVFTLTPLDLNQVVRDTAELLGRLLDERVELRVALDPALGCVRADRTQIEQVLMNLIVNARDAMPDGGRISLRTELVELGAAEAHAHDLEPGRYARVVVRDTGHGMDAATRKRIFEPFFTTRERGTGLGLSTVYGIVTQCGGAVEVLSEPGEGATFRIHLPHVAQAGAIERPPVRRSPLHGTRGTVLLVEDQDEVRSLLCSYLESEQYRVIEASWAGEAALLVEERAEPIDLLVTDVVMPGENGGELARWVTARRPGTPVLYVSGYAGDDVLPQDDGDHATAFLQKPFTKEEFLGRVAELITSRAAA
jgi:signal transduction histidine kinase/CheY-like chemotaxis protein